MAITPTGDIFKGFEFDGESSKDYGVYITGKAVYNAPTRDVEMVSIPGRNGKFALDKGRFENIEITYPAGIFADDEVDFAEAISDFRNYMCSRKGYVRLSDDYNPNEYRMAFYKSGLDVSPAQLKAGEFNITFDCKPQRWLTSGEDAITVADGDTLTNPTLFESSPLLEVEGYGTIGFNGYAIEIDDVQIGDVVLINKGATSIHFPTGRRENFNGNEAFLNAGDTISVPSITVTVVETVKPTVSILSVSRESSQDLSDATIRASSSRTIEIVLKSSPIEFHYGTAETSTVGQASFGWVLYDSANANTLTVTGQVGTVFAEYDGDKTITFWSAGLKMGTVTWYEDSTKKIEYPQVTGASSQDLSLGHIYIDCDLGEAYKIESGGAIPLNRYIDLGSDLPKLASGNNTISYDNTITELKITPRWWKL